MTAVLCYKAGNTQKKVPCKTALTLGRDKNSDIILKDLMASRNHAMIRRIGRDDYYLIDSGSTNGSFVNDARIAMPKLLKHGDRIVIGRMEFVFQQEKKIEDFTDTVSMQDTLISDTPVIKQITILVADIRGFTSLSEQVDIKTLTKLMNTWFHNVSDVIFNNGGVVDKFIGDCVFARWEAQMDQSLTIYQALRAAWLINIATKKLNNNFSEVTEQIKIGVGINTGAASLDIGHDNTALGDAVNIAFRLESATKMLGKDIVISESSYRHLPGLVWEGNEQQIMVKGKRDPVRICSLEFQEMESLLRKITPEELRYEDRITGS